MAAPASTTTTNTTANTAATVTTVLHRLLFLLLVLCVSQSLNLTSTRDRLLSSVSRADIGSWLKIELLRGAAASQLCDHVQEIFSIGHPGRVTAFSICHELLAGAPEKSCLSAGCDSTSQSSTHAQANMPPLPPMQSNEPTPSPSTRREEFSTAATVMMNRPRPAGRPGGSRVVGRYRLEESERISARARELRLSSSTTSTTTTTTTPSPARDYDDGHDEYRDDYEETSTPKPRRRGHRRRTSTTTTSTTPSTTAKTLSPGYKERSDGRVIDFLGDPNFPYELKGADLTDYPFYVKVPEAVNNFDCKGRHDGYYANVDLHCQIYHHCAIGFRYDFLCPNYTLFDQTTFTCRFINTVNCGKSANYYKRNEDLYIESTTVGPDERDSNRRGGRFKKKRPNNNDDSNGDDNNGRSNNNNNRNSGSSSNPKGFWESRGGARGSRIRDNDRDTDAGDGDRDSGSSNRRRNNNNNNSSSNNNSSNNNNSNNNNSSSNTNNNNGDRRDSSNDRHKNDDNSRGRGSGDRDGGGGNGGGDNRGSGNNGGSSGGDEEYDDSKRR